MCLAVPMRVIAVLGNEEDPLSAPLARVELDGIERDVRLDLVDRWPREGEYLIIHAGFAIHTLDAEEAETNLRLMREMAEALKG